MFACKRLFLIFCACVIVNAGVKSIYPTDSVKSKEEVENLKKEIGVEEQLSKKISSDTIFINEVGDSLSIKDIVRLADKPLLIIPVYYTCPHLCTLVLNGFVDVLNQEKQYRLGQHFSTIMISMNPEEGTVLARQKKENYLKQLQYSKDEKKLAADSWHFLTGSRKSIAKLLNEIGFRYKKEKEEYAHVSVITFITEDLQIARYLYGVSFEHTNFRLALIEAGKKKIATVTDQILFYCFQYDSQKRVYNLIAWKVMTIGVLFFTAIMIVFLSILWFKKRNVESN